LAFSRQNQVSIIPAQRWASLSSKQVFSNPKMSLKRVVFGQAGFCPFGKNILPAVVVAVGMWESVLSISKDCGKGGKQHYRFPGFP
jgi:hypothetical protein